METEKKEWTVASGHYQELPDRKLKESTLKFWQYQVGVVDGIPSHIANVKDEHGKLVAQKLRQRKDGKKTFTVRGKMDNLLYGMWLWTAKGKSITITEGELDALSVSQANDNKWPVVSLPNGANSVKATIKRCYDYLMGFEKIVLMFDMDDPGRKAVEEAVELLPAGKVYVATLPEKDANETLIKHGPAALVKAFWDAKQYRPDGIISGAELDFDTLYTAAEKGYDLRYPKLNKQLMGLRKGEITLFTAGSGIGKSTLLRQICYDLTVDHGLKIGNLYLEENNQKTGQAYIAIDNQVPLSQFRYDPSVIPREMALDSYNRIIKPNMVFYNHFGSLESDRLFSKLHYMATVLGVDFIALDHISIVTSGLESSSEGERKDIDILMTRLASLVQETGVGVLGVVHLKRVQGKSFNEGSMVSLSDLRGSGSLEQLSFNVVSLERDQQGEKKDTSISRVLKCRETGDTGEADTLVYDRQTGLMKVEAFKSVDTKEGETVDL